MKHFHGHLYFDDPSEADAFCEILKSQDHLFHFHRIYHKKVGPHPKPMLEIHFSDQTKERVLSWMRREAKAFTIMVHEDTGDDFGDHTERIEWIGTPLEIDFSFFHAVAADPRLLIHPKNASADHLLPPRATKTRETTR